MTAGSNQAASSQIYPGEASHVLHTARAPADRAKAIEIIEEIESEYCMVGLQRDSDVPENAEDEVDFHPAVAD